jgi:hexosaminidase
MKVSLITLSALLPSAFALWPLPTGLSLGTTPLKLSKGFDIKIGIPNPPADLVAAVSRAKGFLANDKLQALVVDRGASSASAIAGAKSLPSLTLSLATTAKGSSLKSISAEAIAPIESRVEGYTLTVPADGSGAVLKANSSLGLLHGLTTFGQLWYSWKDNTYSLSAPIQITDAPAYVRACTTSISPHLTYIYLIRSPIADLCWTLRETCTFVSAGVGYTC